MFGLSLHRDAVNVGNSLYMYEDFPLESVFDGVAHQVHEDLDDPGLVETEELRDFFVDQSLDLDAFVGSFGFVGGRYFVDQLSYFYYFLDHLESAMDLELLSVQHIVHYAREKLSTVLCIFH